MIIIFCCFSSRLDITKITGCILTGDEDNEKQAVVIDISKGEKSYFDYTNTLSYAGFAENASQLILRSSNDIYLYDVKTKEKNLLCELDFKDFTCVKYINKEFISFIKDKSLILYNIKSKESNILVSNIIGDYSYSQDTFKIYYADEYNKIYELNLANMEIKEIDLGYNPKISKNGKVIAYRKVNTAKSCIVIRNIEDGNTFEKNIGPSKYLLSPDGKYLLMVKYEDKNVLNVLSFYFYAMLDYIFDSDYCYLGEELVIYDYQNEKSLVLLKRYSTLNFQTLDWI